MSTNIITYDFKEGLPQQFEILDIKSVVEEHAEKLTIPHRAGFYHIIWFKKGVPAHLVDFKSISIKPDTLLFLNQDTVQRYDSSVEFEAKAIIFTDRFFCKTEADTKFLKNSILFRDLFSVAEISLEGEGKVFADLIRQMEEELGKAKDNFQEPILQNLLYNFLLHSERERRKQNFIEVTRGPDLDYLMLFIDLLESEFKTQKKVSFYAGRLFITTKRLNQATAKVMGKTPKEIIDERVLLEAKRILAYTTESSKEIAFQLGFNEPTNFVKYFKKHSGQTPTEFRESFFPA